MPIVEHFIDHHFDNDETSSKQCHLALALLIELIELVRTRLSDLIDWRKLTLHSKIFVNVLHLDG